MYSTVLYCTVLLQITPASPCRHGQSFSCPAPSLARMVSGGKLMLPLGTIYLPRFCTLHCSVIGIKCKVLNIKIILNGDVLVPKFIETKLYVHTVINLFNGWFL